MIEEKDIQLVVYRDSLRKYKQESHYRLVIVDKLNYTSYKSDLTKVVNLIKQQLTDWTTSPNYSDLITRFDINSICYLFYFKDECIGWNWTNKDFTADWVNIEQRFANNICYAGGSFVSNIITRPSNAGMSNYNLFFKTIFDTFPHIDTICGYCDWWNRPAIIVNYKNGFINKNWYGRK